MPSFSFRARDDAGRPQAGAVVAVSATAAAAELRARGWLLLHLHGESAPARARAARDNAANASALPLLRPSSREVAEGLRHIALMLRSGLTLLDALRTVARHARRQRSRVLWNAVADRVEGGSSLVAALESFPVAFPPLLRELSRAGEQSGTLDTAFDRGAEHLERARDLRVKFLQAIFYPALVLTLTTAVTLFMFVKVMPALEQFLAGTHRKIPALTQAVLDVSHFLRENLATIALVTGATLIAAIALDASPITRPLVDRFLYRVPLLGRLRRLAATVLFTRSLHVLLESGIGIVRALELVEGIVQRPVPALAVARARERILAGSSFADGLADARAFTPWIPGVIAVGERSGSLDAVLREAATFHEAELQRWLRVAGMLIEPILTIAVGVVVGIVYAAFFIAIFSMAGGPG